MANNPIPFRPTDEDLKMIEKLMWFMKEENQFGTKVTRSDVLRAALKTFYEENFYKETQE